MSAGTASMAAPAMKERADLSAWLAVAAGTLAAFMALLDTSIVNASLPVIQGEIGATTSEGTWLGTSYLVAEIVVMPLTVWFERLFGLRRVLMAGSIGFTIFSVVCGLSGNLTMMIIGRIGQGLAGGVMIPTGLTILAKRLPPSQQAIGMAIFAASALIGPISGPVLGGWITEQASWHYVFFINVPICAALVTLILAGLKPDAPERAHIGDADWLGVFGMMFALGGLTVLLEEGHRERWFESALILQLAAVSAFGFILVAIGQLTASTPVMKLALLRDRGLSAVLFLTMVIGIVLFSTMFTVPQFLAIVAGYNSLQAGTVMTVSGGFALCAAVLYPVFVRRIDVRIIVGFGFLVTGTASWLASGLTADSVGSHFVPSLILMGLGTTFSAIPLQQAALSTVVVDDTAQVTSMFNICRNIGGSIGLALLSSVLDQRIDFHHWRLHEGIPANDPEAAQRLAGTIGQGASVEDALRLFDAQVQQQAIVMSFGDIFVMLAMASFLAMPLILLLKPIDPARAGAMAH